MLLEIVVKYYPKHVMETCEDDWEVLLHVIFEEEMLDVNQLYPLKEIHKIFYYLNH
jgi:hypothetical protein